MKPWLKFGSENVYWHFQSNTIGLIDKTMPGIWNNDVKNLKYPDYSYWASISIKPILDASIKRGNSK